MKEETFNRLLSTPFIPETVYKSLPWFLKDLIEHFSDRRERDVVLVSSLVILSGCLPGVRGKYRNDFVYSNLFGFVMAPAASGKGVMKYTRHLGKAIQDDYLKNGAILRSDYDREVQRWKRKNETENGLAESMPIKPKMPVLFIPGNISSAAIYELLSNNDGLGIICETEADALTGAIKQNWGDFSDLLRRSFHHEALNKSRFINDYYLIVEKPRLAILLSGTPEQVLRLISSAEDGLFSRFVFYCYCRELKWLDPAPCEDCLDLDEFFKKCSAFVANLKAQIDIDTPEFGLTKDQFSRMEPNFTKKLKSIGPFGDTASVVYRLGLICFRIAMILTIVRLEGRSPAKHISCSDQDFETSLALIDVFFEHSMIMYSLLPKSYKETGNPKLRELYSLLPENTPFERSEANEIGDSINVSERTVYNYLTELTATGHLINPKYGVYVKL